jgi:excisionase family DNA binding protein
MIRKALIVLILKQMDELDRWYGADNPDPEKYVAKERRVVDGIANEMARVGFANLHAASIKLQHDGNPEAVKTFLARCLKALRPKRLASSRSDMLAPLTVKEAAGRLRVSAQRVYGLCAAGNLRCVKIGRTIRVTPEEIDRFLAKQTKVAMPEPPPGDYQFLKLKSAGQPSPLPRRRRGSRPAS